ncbi:MAG TPA: hypothetical protein VGF45_02960, partial [Polyangia bacterium]
NLTVTETGKALLAALPVASLASSELTGRWEARLSRIARGLEGRAGFMQDIAKYVADVVDAIKAAPVRPLPPSAEMTGARRSEPFRGAGAPAGARTARASGPARATVKSDPSGARGRRPARGKASELAERTTSVRPVRATGSAATGRSPASAGEAGASPIALACPRCGQGTLMTGKRGWGCSRWREGCGFVVWFEIEGKRLSETHLRDLVRKGKTRKTRWPRAGSEVAGHLVLDVGAPADRGAVRFEPAPAKTTQPD